MVQVFIPYSEATHPPQTKYMGHMPSPEILSWLNEKGLDYWAMGWPQYKGKFYKGEFLGSGFNFHDPKLAMLFKLTWVGI